MNVHKNARQTPRDRAIMIDRIAAALGMARSTVGLALRRLGLGKLKLIEPRRR